MNKINLTQFLKKLDPEFTNIERDTLDLLPEAYLLDNNDGLKKNCNCVNLKSTDFLLEKNGNLYFIEFSDLGLENENNTNKIRSAMRCCQGKPCPAKDYPKLYYSKKINDFSLKYKDTLLFLYSIRDDLEPNNIFHENVNQWHYIIVHNKGNNIDFIRYLDQIKGDIFSSIPERLLNRNNFKFKNLTEFIGMFQ